MANEIQELKFQVGEAWKGVYSSSTAYGLANVVQDPTGLSIYRSLKSGNVGHPLSNASWWFRIIDLSSIKAESDRIAALNQSIAQDEALRVAAEELRQQHEAERVAAETQRDEAEQARISAEQQRVNKESQREAAEQQRISAEQGRVSAESARVQAEQARVLAETLRANAEDQRAANEQNRVAAEQQRIERAEQDHQRAESDHATYVDSLGAFDISSYHATDGVLAKYADLTAALGTGGANIPDDLRKGGMSIKFVQSSDNKYVQYRLIAQNFTANTFYWERYNDITTSNQQESDLDISDEQGNVLIQAKDGHIKTKNFDSAKDATTEERGLMSTTDKTKLNSIEEGAEVNDVETDNITNGDLDISDEQGNVLIQAKDGHIKTKNFDSSKTLQNRYLPYQRRTYFAQSVNTFNFLTTDFIAESINSYDEPVYYNDNVVLYLPTSYSVNGNPTKLIIYCKHGASTIEPSSDDILTGSIGRIFRYMLHLGYGILAADGVPNGWATVKKLGERVVGNYVAVESTIRAFEYVKEKYNIDHDNVYIFGYSQGGHYAQNVIDNSNIPIAAAAELSPVCSMRYHQWDLNASGTVDGVSYTKLARLNIARIFDFPAVANNTELLALEYDPIKTVGYDPWNHNVENMFIGFEKNSSDLWVLPNGTSLDNITMKKHIRCPLKIWAANNDNALGVDVMKVFIKAIKNSGQVADLQLYTTGAHSIPIAQSSIGTFVENGDTCDLYPIAVDIAGWFFQFGGYKLV